MVNWRRAARAEEIDSGFFKWLNTGVIYGDDGFKNLRQYIPVSQTEWLHDGTANHAKSDQYDAANSRIMTRITAGAGGSITSRMRKQLLLPRDFGSFPALGFEFYSRSSASIPTQANLSIYRLGAADDTLDGDDILPAVGATYEWMSRSPGTVDYAPGDLLIVEIEVETANNAEYFEIGGLTLAYLTGRGNI